MFQKAARSSFKKFNQAQAELAKPKNAQNKKPSPKWNKYRAEIQCYELGSKIYPPLNYIKDYKRYIGAEDKNIFSAVLTNKNRHSGSWESTNSTSEAKRKTLTFKKNPNFDQKDHIYNEWQLKKAMDDHSKTRGHKNATQDIRTPEDYSKLFAKVGSMTNSKNVKKAFAIMSQKRDDDEALYLERENRGFIKKEFTRSLHILGYADVKEIYGDLANTDPFRHVCFDVMQTNQGDAYRMRRTDRVARRMEDYGRNSAKSFIKVHAASFNTPDYWVSMGQAQRLLEGRRIMYNRMYELFFAPVRFFHPLKESRFAKCDENDLLRMSKHKDYDLHMKQTLHFDPLKSHLSNRFPLILGREFCGTVQDIGSGIGGVDLDERVWGVLPTHAFGSCSDFICPKGYQISPAPENLTDAEAATLPFSAVLFFNGIENICDEETTRGKKILVIGAAGKVGHVATQILVAWGGDVSVMVGQDENDFIKLHTDVEEGSIFNYDTMAAVTAAGGSGLGETDGDPSLEFSPLDFLEGQFDVVVNCCQDENRMYPYNKLVDCLSENGAYVTMNSTLFERAERHYWFNAIFASERDHRKIRKYFKKFNRRAKWANFNDRYADWHLTRLKALVEEEKVKPFIYKSYDCSQSVEAWREFVNDDPKIYGKIVVEFDDKAL